MTPAGLFERDGDWFRATEFARGPWDPNALHGGPVAALLAEAIAAHEAATLPSFMSRLTLELLRPVPLARLRVETTTLRPGRKVAWIDAELRNEDEAVVAVARALRTHRLDPPLPVGDHADPAVARPAHPDAIRPDKIGLDDQIGFWSANDFRLAAGDWLEPGPGAAWFRLRVPVIADEPTSPMARVAAAADFGSGVGNPLRHSSSSSINAELTVHLHRNPRDEWIGVESMAWAHGEGSGLCESRLFDTDGPIGRSSQALLVQDFNPFRT